MELAVDQGEAQRAVPPHADVWHVEVVRELGGRGGRRVSGANIYTYVVVENNALSCACPEVLKDVS